MTVLVGGLYGIAIGRAFFGESMFSRVSNASKVAFVTLVENLKRLKFQAHRLPGENRSSHPFRCTGSAREGFLEQVDKAMGTQ
jgi:leucyl/phenylalanyl-tRNA--protein transferase